MTGSASAPRRLPAQPLTAEAFAPFGSLATLDATGGRPVNQDRARRTPGLGDLAPSQVDSLVAEIDRLATWHDRSVASLGRTTVGVSGLDMPAAGALVSRALDGELPQAQALKEAIDDLRAYYLEAASAFPDPGTPTTRKKWFWEETRLAQAILALQPRLAASADPQHRILANLTLVPATERHRLG